MNNPISEQEPNTMSDDARSKHYYLDKRIILCIDLLQSLDKINTDLTGFQSVFQSTDKEKQSIENTGTDDKLQTKKNQLTKKNNEITSCLEKMTSITNNWHQFTQDKEECKHWLYPFKLMKIGKNTNTKLKIEQEKIQACLLQKRLLEEDIRHVTTIVARENDAAYKNSESYLQQLSLYERKKQMIEDLSILLPTLPQTATCVFNTSQPGELMSLLTQ